MRGDYLTFVTLLTKLRNNLFSSRSTHLIRCKRSHFLDVFCKCFFLSFAKYTWSCTKSASIDVSSGLKLDIAFANFDALGNFLKKHLWENKILTTNQGVNRQDLTADSKSC